MNDFLLFAVLFVAVGAGWLMGRGRAKTTLAPWQTSDKLPSQYYRGLNFLLDGSQDGAIDAFTQALEVNSETFDTHIALGNVLRRRGEVDRAIRIHQNLLARPSLPASQLHLAHLELSRDYISAGLLDRAERLLLDLVAEAGHHRRVARRHLLEIYEAQRDWLAAQAIATELLPKRSLLRSSGQEPSEVGQPIPLLLAQYCCEQGSIALEKGDLNAAREQLDQALKYDKSCTRATLMLGELDLKTNNPGRTIKTLQMLKEQAPNFVPESAGLLREAYQQLNRRPELRAYLSECYQSRPSTPLLIALAEEIRAVEGAEAAKQYLREKLIDKPSLQGLALLMELHNAREAGDDESLQIDIIKHLVEARSSYRCTHCGFRGQHLHWYCPGCKHWGTICDLGSVGEIVRA